MYFSLYAQVVSVVVPLFLSLLLGNMLLVTRETVCRAEKTRLHACVYIFRVCTFLLTLGLHKGCSVLSFTAYSAFLHFPPS